VPNRNCFFFKMLHLYSCLVTATSFRTYLCGYTDGLTFRRRGTVDLGALFSGEKKAFCEAGSILRKIVPNREEVAVFFVEPLMP
jgi:hypothetical protein